MPIVTHALLYAGYLFVLDPVGQLKQAIEKIQGGDLGARVEKVSSDEFGTLADGFNGMAEHLQSMYRNLESRVAAKTAELEDKGERLESLYQLFPALPAALMPLPLLRKISVFKQILNQRSTEARTLH